MSTVLLYTETNENALSDAVIVDREEMVFTNGNIQLHYLRLSIIDVKPEDSRILTKYLIIINTKRLLI